MKRLSLVSYGFTLVELIVVVTVIGLLFILMATNYTASLERSRDAKRKSDLRELKTGLHLYHADYIAFPPDIGWCDSSKGVTAAGCAGYVSNSWPGGGISSLFPVYMRGMPVDPRNSEQFYYYYEPVQNQTQFGVTCGASACAFIISTRLEKANDPQASLGCNPCIPSHNYCVASGEDVQFGGAVC